MKVYTRTGDDGTTGLGSGKRVDKDSLRLEAYGTVDELNSVLGVALAEGLAEPLEEWLTRIQEELFVLGADLAVPDEDKKESSLRLEDGLAESLEGWIDELSESLPAAQEFCSSGWPARCCSTARCANCLPKGGARDGQSCTRGGDQRARGALPQSSFRCPLRYGALPESRFRPA